MKKNSHLLVLARILLGGGVCFSFSLRGEVTNSKVENLVQAMQFTKEKIVTKDEFRRRIMGSLYGVNKRIKKISEEYSELSQKMTSAKANVSNTARQIALLEGRVQKQKARVSRYLRTSYFLRKQSPMVALITSQHPSEVDQSARILRIFAERDYKLIQSYQMNLQELRIKKQDLNKKVRTLVALKERVKTQEASLVVEQDSKVRLLARLRAERERQLARVKALRAKSKDFDKNNFDPDLSEILDISFYERKGKLHPPVDGSILQGYGLIQDPDYNLKLSHKGIFYQVPPGSEVRSVFRGRVSYAGLLPGFGSMILIDHGDHYYSVYSHNQNVKVNTGQKVEEGELIALSGRGSRQWGAGLYFEIRHFSDAIDPKPWLRSEVDLRASHP